MSWFGLGRPRSKLGEWIEEKGLTQEEFARECGVSAETISRLARDKERRPSWKVQKKVLRAARMFDTEISAEYFWGE